jgi:hypothetical protein
LTLIIAKGASGVEHKLWAHPIGSRFNPVQGVYGFCRLGSDGIWYVQYFGQADDLDSRVGVGLQSHHKIGAAVAMGATHVAAAAVKGDYATLCRVEHDIIQGLQPPLNEKAPPGFGLRAKA